MKERVFSLPFFKQLQFHKGQSFSLPPKPFSIEIGCGDGTHSLCYCQENPKTHLIAIEKSPFRFRRFQKKMSQLPQVPFNLHPIQADAISWISHFIPPNSIKTLFILYPNPYPKNSQRNKRWYAMPFMGEIIKRLQTHSQMVLATNELFYLEEATEYLQKIWKMKYLKKESFNRHHKKTLLKEPRTAFEKKYLEQGYTCYSIIFQKPKPICYGHVAQ